MRQYLLIYVFFIFEGAWMPFKKSLVIKFHMASYHLTLINTHVKCVSNPILTLGVNMQNMKMKIKSLGGGGGGWGSDVKSSGTKVSTNTNFIEVKIYRVCQNKCTIPHFV